MPAGGSRSKRLHSTSVLLMQSHSWTIRTTFLGYRQTLATTCVDFYFCFSVILEVVASSNSIWDPITNQFKYRNSSSTYNQTFEFVYSWKLIGIKLICHKYRLSWALNSNVWKHSFANHIQRLLTEKKTNRNSPSFKMWRQKNLRLDESRWKVIFLCLFAQQAVFTAVWPRLTQVYHGPSSLPNSTTGKTMPSCSVSFSFFLFFYKVFWS